MKSGEGVSGEWRNVDGLRTTGKNGGGYLWDPRRLFPGELGWFMDEHVGRDGNIFGIRSCFGMSPFSFLTVLCPCPLDPGAFSFSDFLL